MMVLGVLSALVLVLSAGPADAAPVVTAIAAVAKAIAASKVLTIVAKVVISAAISAWQQRRVAKAMAQTAAQTASDASRTAAGLTTQYTGRGGTTPISIIVGRYATAGHMEAPPISFPQANVGLGMFGIARSHYLTYVIGLGDVAGVQLTGRIVINDVWYTLSNAASLRLNKQTGAVTDDPNIPEFGVTPNGVMTSSCWFRERSGFEITADPFLMYWLADHPQRPWSADMIGRGISHVIATFRRDSELFPSEPHLRFEVRGIPMYDPRFDSTVGGSGPQRWNDRSTWAFSENPKVIEYNIHRGISVDGYGIWGNSVAAADLPLGNWFAAMNACDVLVDNGAGSTEPMYIFGLEWGLDRTPAQIIDEINRSCAGETVEIGGVYKTRVGGPPLPIYFFTDDDVIVTRPQDLEPFPGLDATFNALSCSYPDPALMWEAREAPPFTNPAWEAEDGQIEWDSAQGAFARRPRRLLKEMALPGVSNPRQVQRLLASAAREGRNRRSHSLTLPPEALMLEPLDAVSWTSLRNGFVSKLFDVVMTVDPVAELRARIGLLEADPNDYTLPTYTAYDTPPNGTSLGGRMSPPGVPTPSERLYSTRPGAGLKVALRLIAAPSPSPDAYEYQWQHLVGETWRDLLRSTTSDIELLDAALGTWNIRVRARGVLGAVSGWAAQSFEVVGTAAPPVAVTGALLQSAGGFAHISWAPHPDLDVQEGGAIVVRHSSHPLPLWENTNIEWRCFGRNTSITMPLMPGAYFVRAEDATKIGGPTVMLRTDGIQALGFVPWGQLQEDDDFTGSHTGTWSEAGALYLASSLLFDAWPGNIDDAPDWDYLSGVGMAGIYEFAAGLDLGVPKRMRLRSLIVQEPVMVLDDLGNRTGNVDDYQNWDGTIGAECAVVIEVQTSPSDPVTATDWTDWTAVYSTEVFARAVRARARLTSSSPEFTPRVTQLRLTADEVST
jgi:hypothetical protein